MRDLTQTEKIGSRTALRIGLKIGLLFLFLTTIILTLIAGGLLGIIGLYSILTFNQLYISLLLLYFSFPLALWTLGKRNGTNILKYKSTFRTSLEFSFGVNLIIWTVFLLSQLIIGQSTDLLIWTLATIGIMIILGSITTFTIGIYIVNRTRKMIKAGT